MYAKLSNCPNCIYVGSGVYLSHKLDIYGCPVHKSARFSDNARSFTIRYSAYNHEGNTEDITPISGELYTWTMENFSMQLNQYLPID